LYRDCDTNLLGILLVNATQLSSDFPLAVLAYFAADPCRSLSLVFLRNVWLFVTLLIDNLAFFSIGLKCTNNVFSTIFSRFAFLIKKTVVYEDGDHSKGL
jgi:hypothetical protein